MPGHPLVSVVIPCFNQGDFVPEVLQSVFAQTWQNLEVIVVDDGSTDDTAAILGRIQEARLQVVSQENKGLAAARNRGCEVANGDYVVPLDADDRILPGMIRTCMEVLMADPHLGYAYTHMQLFGDVDEVYKHAPYNFYRLLRDNDVSVCAVVRKEAWRAAGGYSSEVMPGIADWDFWLRCGSKGWHGRLVPEALFEYRVRKGSMWEKTRRDMEKVRQELRAAHPDLYSETGMARIRSEWHRTLDPHAPDGLLARAAKAMPTPVRHALSRAYRRWILR